MKRETPPEPLPRDTWEQGVFQARAWVQTIQQEPITCGVPTSSTPAWTKHKKAQASKETDHG